MTTQKMWAVARATWRRLVALVTPRRRSPDERSQAPRAPRREAWPDRDLGEGAANTWGKKRNGGRHG